MNSSPFLDIPESEYIRESSLGFAVKSLYAVSPGHSLVIPKRHIPHWKNASSEEKIALMDLVDEVIEDLEKEFDPDGFNVGWNEGESAGQTIFHLHIHVIPRFEGDVEDPRGGVRYVIPDKANYLKD